MYVFPVMFLREIVPCTFPLVANPEKLEMLSFPALRLGLNVHFPMMFWSEIVPCIFPLVADPEKRGQLSFPAPLQDLPG